MDFIKSLISIASDPISHVLFFLVLSWKFRSLHKYFPLAILYLMLVATPILNKGLLSLWSVSDSVNNDITYDATVLLLGVTDFKWHMKYIPDKRNGYCNLNQNASRVGYLLRKYREGHVSRVFLGQNNINGFNETACVRDMLLQQGIDEKNIFIMGNVSRTLDEIRELKKVINQFSSKRVLLITSSQHMRRALAFASAQGFNVDHYSTDKVDIKYQFKELIPSSKWLVNTSSLLYEILAYSGYRLTGKL